ILAASRALETANLLCGHFEETTRAAKAGDLVYLDPPYPKGAVDGNGFARYSKTGFTLEDHKRLAKRAAKLADLGVHILITEAARSEIIKLYSRAFHTKYIRSSSLIAAESEYRRQTYEVILTSYRTDAHS
ncbi:MAG: DNA adenine methylase, partial [Candidatus Zixiibacteriota bacterium]